MTRRRAGRAAMAVGVGLMLILVGAGAGFGQGLDETVERTPARTEGRTDRGAADGGFNQTTGNLPAPGTGGAVAPGTPAAPGTAGIDAAFLSAIDAILQALGLPSIFTSWPGAGTGATVGTGTGTVAGPGSGTGARTGTGTGVGGQPGTGTGAGGGSLAGPGSGSGAPPPAGGSFAERAAKFTGPKWKAHWGYRGGDTNPDRNIEGFGFEPWFCELQQCLIERQTWGADEEEAQKLLEEYATARAMEINGGKLHSTFGVMFRYVGLSALNNKAIEKYNWRLRRSGDLGGNGSANNWCAHASRGSLQKGLPNYRFTPGTPPKGAQSWGTFGDWAAYGKGRQFMERSPAAQQGLAAGDVITLADDSGADKHVATVVGVKDGKVLYVSGNAGGAPGGTVRIEAADLSRINLVERYSKLDRASLDAMSADELAAWGIRRAS